MPGVGVKRTIENKVFAGRIGSLGRVIIILKTTTGAPDSANKVGALCWNTVDGDAYICTVAAGTWVKLNA